MWGMIPSCFLTATIPKASSPGPTAMEGTTIDLLYAAKPISNVPGKSLTTLKITYEPGASTPPHRHGEAFVTAVVLSGFAVSHAPNAG